MCDCSAQIHKYTNYILVRRLRFVYSMEYTHARRCIKTTATVAVLAPSADVQHVNSYKRPLDHRKM